MAGKFGGRVFAGEDSEDESDGENEIQYNFQFSNSFGAPAPASSSAVAAPRFSVPAPVSAGGEDSEEDESDEDASSLVASAPKAAAVAVTAPVAAGGEDSEEEDEEDDDDGAQALAGLQLSGSSESRGSESRSPATQQEAATAKTTVTAAPPIAPPIAPAAPAVVTTSQLQLRASPQPQKTEVEDDDAHWRLGDGLDGVRVMGDAIVTRLQPSLDDSITRIAELTECQQELLQLLASQHASVCANEQIKKVAVVMDKLPHYIRKVQDIRAAMAEISASVERMKKRGESLRVDAQSHALKKESKRDSLAQWNKLHAK